MDMKLSENNTLSKDLQALPQLAMPKDIFAEIQTDLHQSQTKKHRLLSFVSVAAVMLLVLLFFKQQNTMDDKDKLIQELVKRTVQLQQLLAKEEPKYSIAGSEITERIVNIESYLAQLDISIQQTKDKQKKSQLIAAKIDLLGDLVLLQRKINQKANYQKVKPLII